MEAIHPTAAKALRRADVPLRVTNAFDPGDPGTLIDDQPAGKPGAEIVTGLNIYALEVFEQDMVGVKGYDATILEVLKRHGVWIVSKTSNANTITHYVDAPLKSIRRVERDLAERYPSADLNVRALSIASVIGRDMGGLRVLSRGLAALEGAGIDIVAAQQTTRRVDVQFVVGRDDLKAAIRALHAAIINPGAGGAAAVEKAA
jgi:aspartate kinase